MLLLCFFAYCLGVVISYLPSQLKEVTADYLVCLGLVVGTIILTFSYYHLFLKRNNVKKFLMFIPLSIFFIISYVFYLLNVSFIGGSMYTTIEGIFLMVVKIIIMLFFLLAIPSVFILISLIPMKKGFQLAIQLIAAICLVLVVSQTSINPEKLMSIVRPVFNFVSKYVRIFIGSLVLACLRYLFSKKDDILFSSGSSENLPRPAA